MRATFLIRRATLHDVATLARHRAEIFRDMGLLSASQHQAMAAAARRYFEAALLAGEYLAWVAEPESAPGEVVAGAGLQLRRVLPSVRLRAGVTELALGPQGLVLNVFTERAWRRRGAAAILMQHVLTDAREAGVSSVVLHPSAEGRPLYEALGFEPTNEMRYTGEL